MRFLPPFSPVKPLYPPCPFSHPRSLLLDADQQIQTLERHLTSLRTIRNTFAPISALPDELLSRIFRELLWLSPWSVSWTKIVLVSRRWSGVALDDGQLWTYISNEIGVDILPITVEWLKRSKEYPIHFSLAHCDILPSMGEMVASVSHRLSEVKLEASSSEMRDFFASLRELPALRTLALIGGGQDCTVPSTLERVLPRLKVLRLDLVHFPSTDILDVLSGLVELDLDCSGNNMGRPSPTLPQLGRLLRRSPALRFLQLRHSISRQAESETGHSVAAPRIPLLQLEELRLADDIGVCTNVIRSLTLPPSTNIEIAAQEDIPVAGGRSDHLSNLLVPVRLHLRRRHAPIMRNLRVWLDHTYTMAALYSEPTTYQNVVDHEPHARITCGPRSRSEREVRRTITKIFNALPLQSITTLDLESAFPFTSPATWRTLFLLIPQRLTITIGINDSMRSVLTGFMDALDWYLKRLATAKIKKRKVSSFRLQLQGLLLNARYILDMPSMDDMKDPLCGFLLGILERYRDLDLPWKRAGERVGKVAVDSGREGFAHTFQWADRLFGFTDDLEIDGFRWQPSEKEE